MESSAVQTIWATITSDLVHSASPLTSPRLDALRATKSAGKLPDGLADSGLGEVLLARVAAALESGEAIAAEEEHIIADLLCFGGACAAQAMRAVANWAMHRTAHR